MSHETYGIIKSIDGRIDLRQPRYVAFEGPANVTYQQITPPDQTVLNPLFTVNVPSTGMGVNRCMMMTTSGSVTITGTAINNFATQQSISLRAWPLHQCMGNLQAQINDGTITITPNLYITALAMVGNDIKDQSDLQSTTATVPDSVCDYASAVGTIASPFANALDQNNNGLASCRTQQITNIVYTGTTSVQIFFTVSEPLLLSPFTYSSDSKKSLFGINTMNITINYNNLQRLISFATPVGTTISNITGAFSAQALQVSFVAPTENSLTLQPRIISYNYAGIQQIPTTIGGTLAANGGQAAVSSNSIELSIIPSKFIIFAVPAFSDTNTITGSIPDFFFPISNVSIQYGQKSGLLAGASQIQLWETSRRNGVNASYQRWAGSKIYDSAGSTATYGGAPFVVDVAADLGLPTNLTAGMNVRTQFVINCNVTNQTGVSYNNCRFVVVAITPGIVSINGGSTIVMLGGLPGDALVGSSGMDPIAEALVRADASNHGYSGGSFWSSLKKGFSVAGKAAKVLAPALSLAGGPELGMAATAFGHAFGGGARLSRGSVRNTIRSHMY